jgi:hypothetical protein
MDRQPAPDRAAGRAGGISASTAATICGSFEVTPLRTSSSAADIHAIGIA